jgi:hypothetical protein
VSGNASAVKLVVRGAPTLQARATLDGGAYVVRGTLLDDMGAAVSGATVEIGVIPAGGSGPMPLPAAVPCGPVVGLEPRNPAPAPALPGVGGAAARLGGPRLSPNHAAFLLPTDESGAFCVRALGLPDVGLLAAKFAGLGPLDAVSVEIPYDASKTAPAWQWDPRPDEVDLDVPQALFTVVVSDGSRIDAQASGDGTRGHGVEGLPLTLWDERGVALAHARTDVDGRATLAFSTQVLGEPGAGSWEVMAGSTRPPDSGTSASKAPLRATISRVSRVSLVTAAPTEPIVASDGHRFAVVAQSSRGDVEGGVVEAVVGDRVVGVGPVHTGHAEVNVAFELKGAGSIPITFRYLPSSPFLRAGPPITLSLPVRPPSPLRRAPLLLLGLVVLGWIARSWRRAPAAPRAVEAVASEPVAGLVARTVKHAVGWEGVVVDAHSRAPLARVSVAVVTRDFHGERRLLEAVTDSQGKFRLDDAKIGTATLVVESRLHTRLERPLPPPGRLSIALVARRRAVLNRLLEAARRVGAARSDAEPTPGQLAQEGARRGKPASAAWALAVESAAFGDEIVDAEREAAVNALETDLSGIPAPDVRR